MIDVLPGVKCTTSAMTAERIRMDVVSQNIANMNTLQGPDGRPYQRQQVVFETVLEQQRLGDSGPQLQSVRVSRIEKDKRSPRPVYNPTHPQADADGNVYVPDIRLHEEMVDLMTASRAFEANLAVMKNARSMALQSLAIGKRS
jgi:flagellar basal-body rod protein FlgC